MTMLKIVLTVITTWLIILSVFAFKFDYELGLYVCDLQEQIDEVYNDLHPEEYKKRQEIINQIEGRK